MFALLQAIYLLSINKCEQETIDFLHLQVNDFLIYVQQRNYELYETIKEHYFMCNELDASLIDVIRKICSDFDEMSERELYAVGL